MAAAGNKMGNLPTAISFQAYLEARESPSGSGESKPERFRHQKLVEARILFGMRLAFDLDRVES